MPRQIRRVAAAAAIVYCDVAIDDAAMDESRLFDSSIAAVAESLLTQMDLIKTFL